MERFKVLVVDDEQDFLETLVNRLKKRNIEAVGVRSGEEAVKEIEKERFDAVFLDVKMPGGMDGVETLRAVKKIQPLTEVILLTGHAAVETSIEGMKLGAFDFLLKPVRLEDLLAKLGQAMEKKATHDQKIRGAKMRELVGLPGSAPKGTEQK